MSVRKLFTTKSNAIEKDVKQRVRAIVGELCPTAHVFMPVQAGFGAPDLDFVISINGFALRIETKVDGKQPSSRQALTISTLTKAGVPVLIIDQHNLVDVAIVVDYLLVGQQVRAFEYSADNREAYTEK